MDQEVKGSNPCGADRWWPVLYVGVLGDRPMIVMGKQSGDQNNVSRVSHEIKGASLLGHIVRQGFP
jgi:hypothetical protein